MIQQLIIDFKYYRSLNFIHGSSLSIQFLKNYIIFIFIFFVTKLLNLSKY